MRKIDDVYCEPLTIAKSFEFDIHRVEYDQDENYSCFMHFHEVHELIIFERVEGAYFHAQGESTIHSGDVVYTPAMEAHNFSLSHQHKAWYIIQFMPELLAQSEFENAKQLFSAGRHLQLSTPLIKEVSMQTHWLHRCYLENPRSHTCMTLLKLLLHWLADNATTVTYVNDETNLSAGAYQKIAPVLGLFRHHHYVAMNVQEAAEKCNLSQSHFSRLFKRVCRSSYSSYILQHKLEHAARMLGSTTLSITDISYELAFANPSHFIYQFKKRYAKTPFQYRNTLLKSA